MRDPVVEARFIERIYWLIRLRWIAVFGVALIVFFASQLLKFSLPVFSLYAIAGILGVYNLIFFFLANRLRKKKPDNSFQITNRIANLQITFDYTCLAAIMHFSGGIENPFIFYFIFHMIISSILLSRRAAFLQVSYAVLLLYSVIALEYYGILPHYCLREFMLADQHENLIYIMGVFSVFVSTLFISAYMATSIVKRLRLHENRLSRANELLRENDRIKSEYVLRVTHDIKEHLAAIQGCLEPVVVGIVGDLNDRQKDLLGRAVQRTEKLMFFVRALLEITRIKLSKHIEIKQFSLRKAVESAVGLIEAKAKEKHLIVSYHIDPGIDMIKGSQIYIEETITNILMNSLKYTPQYGEIDIFVNDKADKVLLQVVDTGIGISEDEIPKLFEDFFRASNAKELEKTGTGLGLAMAKQVVLRHNGKIWVESTLNQGTKVSIELPK
jgi:signal transduction histidine kinase